MNTFQLALLLLSPLGAALSWVACRWWYGRKLHRLEHRIGKLHADRETLQEQVKLARQQLGQAQKDMATWRKAVGSAQHAKAGGPPEDAKPRPAIKMHPEIPSGLVFEAPQSAAHGFADTMAFESDAAVASTEGSRR